MSRDLKDLNPYVAYLAEKLIKKCNDNGINIFVTQTLRTYEEQDELYAQGRTKTGSIVTNARGGYSIHNFGFAFDIAIRNADGSANWNDDDYYPIGQLGKEIGLEWGGDFTSIKDTPHFQYTQGLTTAQFRAGERPLIPNVEELTQQEIIDKNNEGDDFPMFNEEYYLYTYPDIAEAVANKSIPSDKWHYENQGKSEGRESYPKLPLDYTEGVYLKYNSDVSEAVNRGDYINGSHHWILQGWKENRKFSEETEINYTEYKNKIINYVNDLFK